MTHKSTNTYGLIEIIIFGLLATGTNPGSQTNSIFIYASVAVAGGLLIVAILCILVFVALRKCGKQKENVNNFEEVDGNKMELDKF